MSNNIKLPTSGSTNWGAGLNSYLHNLSLRVDNLEKKYNDTTNSYAIESVGYAGSGVVGEFSATLISDTIHVNGNLYLSGPEPLFFNNFTESYDLSSILSQPGVDATKPLFLFLFYDNVKKEWILQANKEFNINYKYILIGLYYNDTFIKYYFSSGKTLMQHSYELEHVWADLDTNDVVLTINIGSNGMPVILNSSNGIRWDGAITLNCGGLQTDNMRIGDMVIEGKENIGTSPKKIITIVDTGHSVITPTLSSLVDTEDGKYFRILVDVFGTLIIQQSTDNYIFGKNNTINVQALYNAKFGNISSIWYAGLPVEIARFGYNKGEVVNFKYVQNNLNNGQMNFYFAKALEGTFLTQQRKNIWLTDDSQIYTDKILFRKNYNDPNYFKLDYKTGNGTITSAETGKCSFYAGTSSMNNFSEVADITGTFEYEKNTFFRNFSITLKENESFNMEFQWEVGEIATKVLNNNSEEWSGSHFTISMSMEQRIKITTSKPEDDTYSVTLIPQYYDYEDTTWKDAPSDVRNLMLVETLSGILLSIGITKTETRQNNIANLDFSTCLNSNNVLWEQTKSERNIILNSPYIALVTLGGMLKLDNDGVELGGPLSLQGTTSINSDLSLLKNNEFNLSSKIMQIKNGVIDLQNSKVKFSGTSVIDSSLSINGDISLNNGVIKVLSDSRFKENIHHNESDFLSVILNTPVVNYNYKNSNIKYIGLLAQDLSSSLEDDALFFVDTQPTEDCPNKLVIKETKLIYILWKALQTEVEERKKLERLIKEGMNYGSTSK